MHNIKANIYSSLSSSSKGKHHQSHHHHNYTSSFSSSIQIRHHHYHHQYKIDIIFIIIEIIRQHHPHYHYKAHIIISHCLILKQTPSPFHRLCVCLCLRMPLLMFIVSKFFIIYPILTLHYFPTLSTHFYIVVPPFHLFVLRTDLYIISSLGTLS